MVYFDHNGNEMRSTIVGLDLSNDVYLCNGSMATRRAFEMRTEEEDVVILNAYLKNGKMVRGTVVPDSNYTTGTWDVNKHPDEQETVYHKDGKEYQVRDGKYVEIKNITVKGRDGEDKKVVPFQSVAHKPEFNGGDANEFSKWIAENMKYPENCLQAKVQGRVMVEFTVTETGKVSDVRILRSVNEDLDKEAVRVVAQSPLWTPGRDENGDTVRVKYVFPVIFKL